VEVTGFPDLAMKYHISGVPKTVVGETHEFVGAGPEAILLKHVQEAAPPEAPPEGSMDAPPEAPPRDTPPDA
jgi:hypothetical protein